MTRMSLINLLLGTAEYAVILPGMLLCLLPVRQWLRFSAKKCFIVVIPSTLLFCVGASYLDLIGWNGGEWIFTMMLIVGALLYFLAVQLPKCKLVYLFFHAVATLSFGGLANHLIEAMLHPERQSTGFYSTWGLLAQWGFSLLFLLMFTLFIQEKMLWLINNVHAHFIWIFACTVPAVFAFTNWMMIPRSYATMSVGRVRQIGWMLLIVQFFLFLLYQVLCYIIAHSLVNRYEAEKQGQLTRLWQTQYETMRNAFLQTERIRHDFRHTARTIAELADQGRFEELRQYVASYTYGDTHASTQQLFCANAASNAVLQYYAGMAQADGISTEWETRLPAELPVSDVDLCLIFGNLLENAIQACRLVPQDERRIRLSADTETPGELYIILINSFNGQTVRRNGRFITTKKDGSSLGLESVTATAEKYHGVTQFYTRGKDFYSNVMLPLNPTAKPSPDDRQTLS